MRRHRRDRPDTFRFDAITLAGLRRRGTLKWGHYGDDVLAAWVAEMDFPTAPVVRQALLDVVDRGGLGYPLRDRASGLREACAAWLLASQGWKVDPERVFVVPDVVKGVELVVDTFSEPGSPVIVPTPAYPPFFDVVRARGRAVVEVPTVPGPAGPALDLEAIDAALAAGARTVVLCHPHNPIGRAYRPAELAALADVVDAHGARVVSDEIHAPLVYPGREHVPYAMASPSAPQHAVTLTSASKAWNVAGLKCAEIVLTNDSDVDAWRKLPFVARQGATPVGIAASVAAFTSGGPWLEHAVGYLDANRRLLEDLVSTLLPGVGYEPPEATYLAWLDCRPLELDDPASFFLERGRVALSDGRLFGAAGRGFVRLNFATSQAILERIVRALAHALNSR